MTQSALIRLSGWGMVVAAICLLLTFAGWPAGFLIANLLITAGLWGLYVRTRERVNTVAQVALAIGILGGLVATASSSLLLTGADNSRTLTNNAMAVMFLGLFGFGLLTLRAKPLSYGNRLPMLAGLIWPCIVIGANVYHLLSGQWLPVPGWLSFALFSVMAIFLAGVGYVLQADARRARAI